MADMDKVQSPKEQPKPKDQPVTEKRELYRVLGPGCLWHAGKKYGPDELIELTSEDAARLSQHIESTDRGEKVPSEKRVAGVYRIAGPGSLLRGDKKFPPDAEILLTSEEARSVREDIRFLRAS